MSGDVGVHLTPRQNRILTLISQGMTIRKIAADLGCSRGAVNSCMHKAYTKLGATSAAHAVRLGFEAGELTASDYNALKAELRRLYRALVESNRQLTEQHAPAEHAHPFGTYLLDTGQAA